MHSNELHYTERSDSAITLILKAGAFSGLLVTVVSALVIALLSGLGNGSLPRILACAKLPCCCAQSRWYLAVRLVYWLGLPEARGSTSAEDAYDQSRDFCLSPQL